MTTFDPIVRIILAHLPAVQAIYVFGSFGTEDERPDSDADIAVLLPPNEAKMLGSLATREVHLELEKELNRDVDLINLRQVSTVLQKEVVVNGRCICVRDRYATEEFEMLTLSYYQKLNEERAGIVESALAGGRFHSV